MDVLFSSLPLVISFVLCAPLCDIRLSLIPLPSITNWLLMHKGLFIISYEVSGIDIAPMPFGKGINCF